MKHRTHPKKFKPIVIQPGLDERGHKRMNRPNLGHSMPILPGMLLYVYHSDRNDRWFEGNYLIISSPQDLNGSSFFPRVLALKTTHTWNAESPVVQVRFVDETFLRNEAKVLAW